MGLLDDLLYGSPNGQGMGMLNYSAPGFSEPDSSKKAASAQDLAVALGLNDAGGPANSPLNPVEQQMMTMAGPNQPVSGLGASAPAMPTAAPSLSPIERQMMTMTGPNQPVSGLGFGQGATPPLFVTPPGSTPGNPALPPPPAPAISPAVANANAQGDDDDAPATPAAASPSASPIAVGNVNMPRVGSAASFAPPQAAAPVAAAPAASGNPVSNFFNRGADALHSIAEGGSLLGAVRGQYDDPTSLQARSANVTAQALLAKGVDPKVVAAAVQPGNGEMLKALLPVLSPQSYTQETDSDGNSYNVNKQTGQKTVLIQAKDDKFQHFVVKNPDGSESVKSFNTKTGEVTDVPNSGANGARPAIDENLTGKDRMAAIMASNPNYGRKIQAMVNGDVPLPSMGQASRSPQAQKMIEDVLAVDGSTSASDFATRAATRKDYASGVASRVTKSINTTIGHFAKLDQDVDKLHNYTYFPSISNYVHDKVSNNIDPDYQNARSDFEMHKEAAIKELDFALSGGHSSVTGSAEIRDKINRADSPGALHTAITGAMDLLDKRLQSHAKGYSEGTKSQRDGQDFLYPENRAIFNKLTGTADTSTGQPVYDAPAPGAAPQAAAPVAPKLEVGQSTTIGNTSIKRIN